MIKVQGVKRENTNLNATPAKRPNTGNGELDDEIAIYLRSKGYNKSKLLNLAHSNKFNTTTSNANPIRLFDPDQADSNIESWLESIDKHAVDKKLQATERIALMKKKLTGSAEIWYSHLNTLNYTWEEWKTLLTTSFSKKGDLCTLLNELMSREKRNNENYSEYFRDKFSMCIRAGLNGQNIVYFLVRGLDHDVRAKAQEDKYSSAEDLYNRFLSVLDKPVTRLATNDVTNKITTPTVTTVNQTVTVKATETIVQNGKKPDASPVKKEAAAAPVKNDAAAVATTTVVETPKKLDEKVVEVKTPANKTVTNPPKAPATTPNKAVHNKKQAKKCFICHNKGHVSKDCRKQAQHRHSAPMRPQHNEDMYRNYYPNNASPYRSEKYFVAGARGRYGGFL